MRYKKFFAAVISLICAAALSACVSDEQTAEETISLTEITSETSGTVTEDVRIETTFPTAEESYAVPMQTDAVTAAPHIVETTVCVTEDTNVYEAGEIPDETTETLYEASEIPDETAEPPIDYPELGPLTAGQEQSLKEDFAAFMNETNETNAEFLPEDAVIDKYYGTYHGCEVVFMYDAEHGMTEDYVEFELGGYTFGHSCGSLDIYMHINNGFVDIRSAYDSGYIDDGDLAAIYYYSVN